MFQRRNKQSFLNKLGNWIWPRMGWRRTLTYLWHRLQRIPGTPSSIAAGFGCGAAVAMTPLYGTHMVIGGIIAWAIRGSVLAAMLGAQIANPWTAAPLWFGAYYLGALMLGIDLAGHPPNFIQMFQNLTEATLTIDTGLFMDTVWPVFWPMMVGSVPMGLAAGLVSYFILMPLIANVRRRKGTRRQHGRTRAGAER